MQLFFFLAYYDTERCSIDVPVAYCKFFSQHLRWQLEGGDPLYPEQQIGIDWYTVW